MATALAAFALAGALGPIPAGADQLASERAEAASLADHIQALGEHEAALGERYDAAVATVAAATVRVDAASHALSAAESDQARTMALLQQDAIQAYVGGGPEVALHGSLPAKDLNDAILRQELEQAVASQQSDALDSYQLAADNASVARQALAAARAADARVLAAITRSRRQVQASQAQLVSLEGQVNGRIAALVAEIERQRLLAEKRAEEALLAKERAAAAAAAAAQARAEAAARARAAEEAAAARRAAAIAASRKAATLGAGHSAGSLTEAAASPATDGQPTDGSGSGPSGSTDSPQIPGVSAAASIAVSAAESRVGDPYVWGASGPDSFDCSGLVMWAYAQAGVYLPHYSGAQYDDTVHIPMSDLEPGDLVFPADPGEHVAMYIGNGEIVQAPYTGADVQVIPLTSFFVLASRVG